MNNTFLTSLLLASGLLLSNSVYADHNSMHGEGWANMPNDIHNTRIDTRDSDNSEFTDFVRYGAGADSVNRFDTELTSQRPDRAAVQTHRSTDISRLARTSSNRSQRPVANHGRR